MAKVVTLNPIDPTTFEYQDYSAQDSNLIVNFTIEPTFNPLQNYVAYYVYDLNNDVVFSSEVDFRGYAIIDGQVVLNPEVDLENIGFEEGQYNVVYNFLNNELSSSFTQRLYIDQISSDRTEVRLNTTQIPNLDLISGATSLISQIQSNPGVYFEFFLNFGDNQLIIANNMLLDTSNPEDPTVLVKLYEPLPINFTLKDECWVVTEVADPVAYNIDIVQTFELADENIFLKGPNLNLGIKDEINNSTEYTTYNSLTTSSYATGSTDLQYQINSLLAERGIEINVDYSDYTNFVYFSSALTRLENFYYKLQLIEEYQYSSSISNAAVPFPTNVANSKAIWEAKINEIITTFDGYDYYLYYESSSTSWPKTNSSYPYINAPTTNPGIGFDWFVTQSEVAATFDVNNNNSLIDSIPEYLRNDASNAEYELFIEMLGEMYDNIWIYYQDVTNKFNADNRLQYGISKDLVADALRDLGLKIYQNSFGSADLYTALLGVTPSGSQFPFPYMTGSLPTPTGFEYINTSISSSDVVVPLEDIEKGTYKRLYHNLPMLLKKKGTATGIQDLVTVYGIPRTILRVAEFGGKDKDETNDWDYYKPRYNYKYDTLASGFISSSWILNSDWSQTTPGSVQFRFKLPSSGSTGAVDNAINFPSQSLWQLDSDVQIVLEYTGSGFASGSYSGSRLDPFYQYGTLKVIPDAVNNPNQSASVYLPFFNGGWWSVMATIDSDIVSLYAGDNIYNGDDGSQLGFYASSSVSGVDDTEWISGATSYFATGSTGYSAFSGSLQEVRYYTIVLEENDFKDFIMNPDSIESNGLNNTPDQLAFRASLGGELFTGSVSIHPKVTGSWVATSSFASDSNFYTGSGEFVPNIETVYLDQPAAGIKNIVSNKIHIVGMNLPEGDTLSQYRSIQQQPTSSTYTENLAYTEVAFSPQNEINDDIMDQLGFFNMGEFIGDPRQRFTQATSYPDLDALRNAYFEKYISNYDLNDYIRLIKFFDNSLFKMIKDFTPARASLASGVVVKQHLLERNKYPQPEVTQSLYDYSGSIDMVFISGGAGGSVNNLNGLNTNPYYVDNVYGVTQSWEETFIIPSGVVTQTHDSQDEFYNGEYSGSEFVVEDGELNTECDPYKKVNPEIIDYNISHTTNNDFGQFVFPQQQVNLSIFLSDSIFNGVPVASGEIWTWWNSSRVTDRETSPITYYDTYKVEYIKIAKTSGNGVNLEDYIPNIDKLIIPSIIIDDGMVSTSFSPGSFISLTNNSKNYIELDILNISEKDTYYLLQVLQSDGYEFTITSQGTGFLEQSTPAPATASADPNTQIGLEPFVPIGFYNSSCNPLINNSEVNRLSQWYKQIDYATAQTIPVNFAQIISGSAYPAAIQDSNYTSYQYSGIRYWGSKNTTDNFNTASISQSLVVQGYQNDNIGATTLGYASVDKFDSNILEFNWGGGTYPEIYGGGALSLNQILGVGATRDSVSQFNSTEPGFNKSVEILFPVNSLPVFNQYVTTAGTTVNARVSSIGFTVPALSNYMIASSNASTTAEISASTDYITITGDLSEVNTNNAGNYITGSLIGSSSFLESINQGFISGERWFITLYQNLPSPVVGTLEPLDLGYTNYTVENGYSYPLAAKGVFEITSSLISPVLPTSSFRAGQSTTPLPGRIGFINTGVFTGPVASSVTNLYINDIDDNSNNISSSLEVLNDSQIITLENTTAGTGPFVYNITGTPVDNGTYFTIPVSWVSGAGNLRISGDGGVTFDNYDVYTDGNSRLYLDIPGGTFTTGSQFGNGNNGMLVWKSQGGAYMTFNDATLSGVGKGGLVTSTPSPIIQKDFIYITQNFGDNPKNQ